MKIEKLYTLSQFVDEMTKSYFVSANDAMEALKIIEEYNEFLKQPLKKEMFVNEIEKPTYIIHEQLKGECFCEDCTEDLMFCKPEKWQEAEKKVIFEGWYDWNGTLTDSCNKYQNGFFEDFEHVVSEVIILSDLADKTNGQLKLKNLEI